MEQLDTFLARHAPFDALDPDELSGLAAGATERAYETGVSVLVEDGLPTPGLWVLLTGSMDIVHDGEPIQVLEPGECFGHPSLLTGMAPAFTVRAREPRRARCSAPRRAGGSSGPRRARPTSRTRCESA